MADHGQPGVPRGIDSSVFRPRARGRPRVRSPESARRFQRECIRQMQATRVYLGTAYQRWRSLSFLFKRTSDMAKHLLDVHERHCSDCYSSLVPTTSAKQPYRYQNVNDCTEGLPTTVAPPTSMPPGPLMSHHHPQYAMAMPPPNRLPVPPPNRLPVPPPNRLPVPPTNSSDASTSYMTSFPRLTEIPTNQVMPSATDICGTRKRKRDEEICDTRKRKRDEEIFDTRKRKRNEEILPPMPKLAYIKQEPVSDTESEEAIDLTRDAVTVLPQPSENNFAHSSSST